MKFPKQGAEGEGILEVRIECPKTTEEKITRDPVGGQDEQFQEKCGEDKTSKLEDWVTPMGQPWGQQR